jgi:hypothetical protein
LIYTLISIDTNILPYAQNADCARLSAETNLTATEVDSAFAGCFLEDDEIQEGDWLLMWKAVDNGLPHKTKAPRWIYINRVVGNAVDTEGPYTKAVFELPHQEKPHEPLGLDRRSDRRVDKR